MISPIFFIGITLVVGMITPIFTGVTLTLKDKCQLTEFLKIGEIKKSIGEIIC